MPVFVRTCTTTIASRLSVYLEDANVRAVWRAVVAVIAAVVFGHTAVQPITEPLGVFYALLSGMAFGFAFVGLIKGLFSNKEKNQRQHEVKTTQT